MSLPLLQIIIALLIGIGIGITLQRGRGCTNSAFRNLFFAKNDELALFLVVAVTVELIGYLFLSFLSLSNFEFQSNPIVFSYLLIPFGGLIFGIGTVFAGGCAGGTCYRIGEGSITSLLAFLGFATGIAIFAKGSLAELVNNLRTDTTVQSNGKTPSLELYLPRWFWTVLAIAITLSLVWRYYTRAKNNQLKLTHLLQGWNPITTGVLIGLLGIFARYFSTINGRTFGLSTTDGIGEIFLSLLTFEALGWAGVFIIGLILGAAISAYQINEMKVRVPNPKEIFRFFGGGVLLGSGAMIAQGCNFGHIFGGLPELGISSIVAAFFMVMGNWLGSYVFYFKMNAEIPKSTPKIVFRSS